MGPVNVEAFSQYKKFDKIVEKLFKNINLFDEIESDHLCLNMIRQTTYLPQI